MTFASKKVSLAGLLVLVLVLVSGCTGPPGSAGPPGPAGSSGPAGSPGPAGEPAVPVQTKLSVVPDVIEFNSGGLVIIGSGFTPGSLVIIGIPGLPVDTRRPEERDLWFSTATVNEFGAFTANANMGRSLWRYPSRKVLTEEEVCTVYTVVAKNDLGEKAVAPLLVTKPVEK
ncbi:hypothetical protein ACFLTZ_04275 [Chloroflexota bacterium]